MGVNFNSIVIIESLKETELDGTSSLKHSLLEYSEKRSFSFEYFKVYNSQEFIGVLTGLASKTGSNYTPIIHLAIHGSKIGLNLIHEEVKWEIVEPIFSQINFKSKNNLVITLAVCYGSYILELFSLNPERAPFFAIIGTKKEIQGNLIDDFFIDFYNILLDTLNFDLAFEINETSKYKSAGIQKMDSVLFIYSVIKNYIFDINNGKKRHDILEIYKSNFNKKADYEIKSQIQNSEDIIKMMVPILRNKLSEYLMADEYPELKNKFNIPSIEKMLYIQ
jgi:hypothetical protein